jgi:hypothetical protein
MAWEHDFLISALRGSNYDSSCPKKFHPFGSDVEGNSTILKGWHCGV